MWSFAPQTILLLLALLVYGAPWNAHIRRAHRGLLIGGWSVFAVALVSPLCRLGATLASAHMMQHVLLVTVAPLLLVLGANSAHLPRRLKLSSPFALTAVAVLYGVSIWLWHFPPVYVAVLLDGVIHTIAYPVLVLVALLFWSAVLQAKNEARTLGAIVVLFVTMVHTSILGMLLWLSPKPLYSVLAARAELWGLTVLEDQQLAGLIMWVPMSVFYALFGLGVLALALDRSSNSISESRVSLPDGAIGRSSNVLKARA